jgi:hypothetical protein
MMINFTNHPSAHWGERQKTDAMKYGEVVDIPFPGVPALAEEADIKALSVYWAYKIKAQKPDAVLCQGEFSLCFAVTAILLAEGITVLCAASERGTIENTDADGTTAKETVFMFQRFREYQFVGGNEA